ncbi:MAG: hypothetical protein ACM3X7_07565 [Solirubrobacterales bacterium]
MSFITEMFIKTCLETIWLAGVIITAGFILNILRNNSIKNFQRSFGKKAIIITGILGVPIHEMSHAFIALLFGHKLTKVKLFQSPDENGVMGYVNHTYSRNSIYQQLGNFFIGIAPIIGGTISIIVLMYFAMPETYNQFTNLVLKDLQWSTMNKHAFESILKAYGRIAETVFTIKNMGNPLFYIFIFAAISISSHISLSPADIKGAAKGLFSIILVIFLLNVLNLSKYLAPLEIIRYNMILSSFLLLTIFLSFATYLASLASLVVKSHKDNLLL